MTIPIKYNLRHIVRRWRATSLTVFAIGLVVAMFVSVLALARGLDEAFVTSGDPANLLLLRNGSTSETNSTMYREQYYVVQFLSNVALDSDGNPLAALETLNLASLPKADGGNSNAIIRGVGPQSLPLRPSIRLVEGRLFDPGLKEIIVGTGASSRFANAKVGDKVRLVKSTWTIVGRFDANRSAFDSEFWGDVEELNREFDRSVYSSMMVRAADAEGAKALMTEIGSNQQLAQVKPYIETKYYEEQTKSSAPLRFLGGLVSVIMAVGAGFAAMNAMYASISSRSWEIATLRLLGFSRRSILVAFLLESCLVGALGGIVGGLLALPMNGIATGTTSMVSFAEIAFAFRVTPTILAQGVVFAILIGAIGGFLPALQASRRAIIDSLRDTI